MSARVASDGVAAEMCSGFRVEGISAARAVGAAAQGCGIMTEHGGLFHFRVTAPLGAPVFPEASVTGEDGENAVGLEPVKRRRMQQEQEERRRRARRRQAAAGGQRGTEGEAGVLDTMPPLEYGTRITLTQLLAFAQDFVMGTNEDIDGWVLVAKDDMVFLTREASAASAAVAAASSTMYFESVFPGYLAARANPQIDTDRTGRMVAMGDVVAVDRTFRRNVVSNTRGASGFTEQRPMEETDSPTNRMIAKSVKSMLWRTRKHHVATTSAAAQAVGNTADANCDPDVGVTFLHLQDRGAGWLFHTVKPDDSPLLNLVSAPKRVEGDFSYRVVYDGGVNVRIGPHLKAPTTDVVLDHGTTFSVREQLQKAGETTTFLRLSNGEGWVLDCLDDIEVAVEVEEHEIEVGYDAYEFDDDDGDDVADGARGTISSSRPGAGYNKSSGGGTGGINVLVDASAQFEATAIHGSHDFTGLMGVHGPSALIFDEQSTAQTTAAAPPVVEEREPDSPLSNGDGHDGVPFNTTGALSAAEVRALGGTVSRVDVHARVRNPYGSLIFTKPPELLDATTFASAPIPEALHEDGSGSLRTQREWVPLATVLDTNRKGEASSTVLSSMLAFATLEIENGQTFRSQERLRLPVRDPRSPHVCCWRSYLRIHPGSLLSAAHPREVTRNRLLKLSQSAIAAEGSAGAAAAAAKSAEEIGSSGEHASGEISTLHSKKEDGDEDADGRSTLGARRVTHAWQLRGYVLEAETSDSETTESPLFTFVETSASAFSTHASDAVGASALATSGRGGADAGKGNTARAPDGGAADLSPSGLCQEKDHNDMLGHWQAAALYRSQLPPSGLHAHLESKRAILQVVTTVASPHIAPSTRTRFAEPRTALYFGDIVHSTAQWIVPPLLHLDQEGSSPAASHRHTYSQGSVELDMRTTSRDSREIVAALENEEQREDDDEDEDVEEEEEEEDDDEGNEFFRLTRNRGWLPLYISGSPAVRLLRDCVTLEEPRFFRVVYPRGVRQRVKPCMGSEASGVVLYLGDVVFASKQLHFTLLHAEDAAKDGVGELAGAVATSLANAAPAHDNEEEMHGLENPGGVQDEPVADTQQCFVRGHPLYLTCAGCTRAPDEACQWQESVTYLPRKQHAGGLSRSGQSFSSSAADILSKVMSGEILGGSSSPPRYMQQQQQQQQAQQLGAADTMSPQRLHQQRVASTAPGRSSGNGRFYTPEQQDVSDPDVSGVALEWEGWIAQRVGLLDIMEPIEPPHIEIGIPHVCRVVSRTGLYLRKGPHRDAPRTGAILAFADTFVSTVKLTLVEENCNFLLARGLDGWAFDREDEGDDTLVVDELPLRILDLAPLDLMRSLPSYVLSPGQNLEEWSSDNDNDTSGVNSAFGGPVAGGGTPSVSGAAENSAGTRGSLSEPRTSFTSLSATAIVSGGLGGGGGTVGVGDRMRHSRAVASSTNSLEALNANTERRRQQIASQTPPQPLTQSLVPAVVDEGAIFAVQHSDGLREYTRGSSGEGSGGNGGGGYASDSTSHGSTPSNPVSASPDRSGGGGGVEVSSIRDRMLGMDARRHVDHHDISSVTLGEQDDLARWRERLLARGEQIAFDDDAAPATGSTSGGGGQGSARPVGTAKSAARGARPGLHEIRSCSGSLDTESDDGGSSTGADGRVSGDAAADFLGLSLSTTSHAIAHTRSRSRSGSRNSHAADSASWNSSRRPSDITTLNDDALVSLRFDSRLVVEDLSELNALDDSLERQDEAVAAARATAMETSAAVAASAGLAAAAVAAVTNNNEPTNEGTTAGLTAASSPHRRIGDSRSGIDAGGTRRRGQGSVRAAPPPLTSDSVFQPGLAASSRHSTHAGNSSEPTAGVDPPWRVLASSVGESGDGGDSDEGEESRDGSRSGSKLSDTFGSTFMPGRGGLDVVRVASISHKVSSTLNSKDGIPATLKFVAIRPFGVPVFGAPFRLHEKVPMEDAVQVTPCLAAHQLKKVIPFNCVFAVDIHAVSMENQSVTFLKLWQQDSWLIFRQEDPPVHCVLQYSPQVKSWGSSYNPKSGGGMCNPS